MSFSYNHPHDCALHMNKEGKLINANREWHISNNTYGFATSLGILLIVIALLLAIKRWAPMLSMVGSILVFVLIIGTLSFVTTRPESWVPYAGYAYWSFPCLSGRGRLVINDIVNLSGSLITMSESPLLYLNRSINKSASLNYKVD